MIKMRELRTNALCPCESGLRYGSCCKQKSFKWVRDPNGEIHKQVPIAPEATEVLERARQQYVEVFEREPSKDRDPIFLWKYLISEEEIERQSIDAMRRAGMGPHLIYAFQKTGGLLVTEHNEQLLSEKDLDEWEEAIDEYFDLEKNPPQPDLADTLLSSLKKEIDSCIISLGYTLEHGWDEAGEKHPSASQYFTVDDYVLICATKSMKTLRAIKVLLEENIGADGLALSRHLFENYLHIAFAASKPEMLEHLIDAQIGLKTGTHSFARHANGKIDSRRIIRKKDGAEFIGHISYYKMAEASRYEEDLVLFDYIYNFLSEYTHPSFSGFQLVLSNSGSLDHLSNELQTEAIYFSVCFAAMILDELRRLAILNPDAKSDISTVTRRVGQKAHQFCDAAFNGEEISESFQILRKRLLELGG